ncbi:unnamed protein product [Discula destructiva]
MFGNNAFRAQHHASSVATDSGNNQQASSGSSGLPPQVTSDVQPQEPPLVTVTSDLPEYGGSPSPHPDNNAAEAVHSTIFQHSAAAPHSATVTPGRSRLEVVLNVAPNHRPPPGHTLWGEAELDDAEDELVTSDVHPSPHKKRRLAPGLPLPPPSGINGSLTNPATSHLHAQPPEESGHASTPPPPPLPTGVKRPRGRPKGWRAGMGPYRSSQAIAPEVDEHGNPIPRPRPSKNNPGGAKRRGRPPRAPPPTARMVWERMAAPTYVPFLCEWKGCKAELQNAETLRRHVRKLHGQKGKTEAEGVVCRWGKCGRQQVLGEEKVFKGEEFYEHMEARHLVPLVWHVGDGVRNQACLSSRHYTKEEDDKIPAYLLGPDGQQVTPWVRDQAEEDSMTRMQNRNRLRDILLQRDENAPLAEDDEAQEQSEDLTPV